MPEALEASSLHGFQCDRQLRQTYSPTFALAEKNTSRNGILQLPPEKETIRSPALFRRERERLSCLMCLFGRNLRPSPQCLRYLPLRGRTDRRRQQTRCSAGIGPYVYRWLLRFVSNETLAEDLLRRFFSMCGVRRVRWASTSCLKALEDTPSRSTAANRPRRRGGRVSNCHLVAGKSLITSAASRLALRAPALRAATALTRPNRSAQPLPYGRHAVPTAKTIGPHNVALR